MSARPTYRQWRKEHFPREYEQQRAVAAVNTAVRRGQLVKPSACSRCGQEHPPREIHGHHADYGKPLEVEWLCRWCHNAHHKRERAKATAERRARLKDPRYRICP